MLIIKGLSFLMNLDCGLIFYGLEYSNNRWEMEFPFKAVGFDWAHTLVDLGEEDDRFTLRQNKLPCLILKSVLKNHENYLDQWSSNPEWLTEKLVMRKF